MIDSIARVGDLFAIPFFIVAFVHYNHVVQKKKVIDKILLLFFLIAAVADIVFVIGSYCSC